ncbi:MAG: hypothetical protein MH472_05160 [Bacteroidia bacterium]|nr:hypothetical protein [Bacteroidia bacterium]
MDAYEHSLKHYRDLKNVIDTAYDEGKLEGKLEEKMEMAKKAILLGLKVEQIMELTSLTEEEINKLK